MNEEGLRAARLRRDRGTGSFLVRGMALKVGIRASEKMSGAGTPQMQRTICSGR